MVDTTGSGPRDATGDEQSDPALAQLRRRYNELRADYDTLLARLHDLEAEVQVQSSSAPEPPPVRFGLVDGLLAPLKQLHAEYLDALDNLQNLVDGIGPLLGGGRLKGQRPAAGPAKEPGDEGSTVRLEVRSRGVPALLAFRDRLAALAGVAAVEIHAADQERATLIVELLPSP